MRQVGITWGQSWVWSSVTHCLQEPGPYGWSAGHSERSPLGSEASGVWFGCWEPKAPVFLPCLPFWSSHSHPLLFLLPLLVSLTLSSSGLPIIFLSSHTNPVSVSSVQPLHYFSAVNLPCEASLSSLLHLNTESSKLNLQPTIWTA